MSTRRNCDVKVTLCNMDMALEMKHSVPLFDVNKYWCMQGRIYLSRQNSYSGDPHIAGLYKIWEHKSSNLQETEQNFDENGQVRLKTSFCLYKIKKIY